MTDEDIIKALECCSKRSLHHYPCKDCPLFREECLAGASLMKPSIDLIKRQQLQIEDLRHENRNLECEKGQLEGTLEYIVEQTKFEAIYKYMKILEGKLTKNTDISGFAYQSVIWDMSQSYDEMAGELNG